MVHNVPSIVRRVYVANQSSHNTTRLNIRTANACVIHVLSSRRSLLRLSYIINHTLFRSLSEHNISYHIYVSHMLFNHSESLLTRVLHVEGIVLSITNKAMK